MPESLANESCAIQIGYSVDTVVIAIAEPSDLDTIVKLNFITNPQLQFVHVAEDWIRRQIALRYASELLEDGA
jgi:hypothetical protein